MKITIYLICLIALFCTETVFAQPYKYVDENGNVNFTDDLGRVPPDQREQYLQAEEVSDVETPETDESAAAGGDTQAETAATSNWPDSVVKGKAPEESIDEMFSRLNQTRKDLKAEYESIQKERADLAATKAEATTPETVNAYNQKAKAINERSKLFNEKNKAFEADQTAYNQRVQEELDARNAEAEKKAAESADAGEKPAEGAEAQ